MLHIVGIGDMVFIDKPSDKIITHALASCVAVTAYNKKNNVGGMIHIALPRPLDLKIHHKKGYFAEIGLPLFIKTFIDKYKCVKSDFDIKIYGGANSINNNDVFDIGSKNLQSVKEILDSYSLNYKMVATGGYLSRTIELNIETGEVKLSELPIRI